MKAILPFALILLVLSGACSSAEEVLPQKEQVETCQHSSRARVEYRLAGVDEQDSFYYLVLLNEQGTAIEDVHPHRLAESYHEIGKKVRVRYHFSFQGDFQYISACGPNTHADGSQAYESMREIMVCEIADDPS